MLTDLTFLQQGKRWPPPTEKERLDNYNELKRIFEDEHCEVYREQMKRITRVIGNFEEVISYPVILNYQKLMSVKLADLLFGEPPKITAKDEAKQDVIDRAIIDSDIINKAYTAAIDVSRYGDSIICVSKKNGALAIDTLPPSIWFPVVDRTNIKHILYHVLAYQYPIGEQKKSYRLFVQIHKTDEPGECEEHTYELSGSEDAWSIGREITNSDTDNTMLRVPTDLNFCPVFRVSNLLTSDRIYGIDDYNSIDSIVSELIVRVTQISKILDVHANPSMSGPQSALEQDPVTGQWRLRVGDYFARNTNEDPAPEYITWDASFEANFKQIELLLNQLYSISEMGSAIFGDTSTLTGQVTSGTALRRLMMSPLAKVRRMANGFDPVLKRIIALCAEIYGVKIDTHEISIAWNDGLPNDEMEEANIMSIRTGGKPTISQYSAIQRLDNLSDANAETELEMIREDENASNPVALSTIDQGAQEEQNDEASITE